MNSSKRTIQFDFISDLIVFALFYALIRKVELNPGDDFVYQNIVNDRSFFEWLNELYQMWSGRVVLTGLLVHALNLPIFIWRLMNSLMFTLLVRFTSKLSSRSLYFKALVFALMILMPEAVLSSGAFWITGSLNYLWPVSMMVFLLYHLKISSNEISFFKWFVLLIALLLATNNEQSSLVLLAFYGIMILYDYFVKKKLDHENLIVFGLISIGFLALMLAPGNFKRLQIETLGLNPSFSMLDIYDKLMIGIQYAFNVLFNGLRYHLLVISVVLLYVSFKQSKRLFWFSTIHTSLILFKVLFDLYIRYNPYCTACNDMHYILFNFRYFDVYNLTQFIHLIPTLLGIIYLLSIVLNYLSLNFIEHRSKLFNLLILLSGLASAVILGFSPTIEASGNRIFFLLSVNTIVFTVHSLSLLDTKKHRILFWIMCSLIIVIAALRVNTLLRLEFFEVLY